MRNETIDQLGKTMRRLRSVYDRKAAAYGLTLSRVRVLRALQIQPGLSQLELADQLEIEAPTLKRQLDALIDAGLVLRGEVASGRRGKGLYLSQEASSHAFLAFSNQARVDLLTGITDDELAAFGEVLRKIGANIDGLEQK